MTLVHRFVAAAFILALSIAAAVAAPAITLAPKAGPPTTVLEVSGTGFGANAAVDVYFDTAHLCLAFANGAGAASCTITVPKDAQPQAHWLSMLQRNTGTGAQKPFTVRTDMAQFHGRNAAHNGVNPFENTLNVNNVGDLDTLWSRPVGPLGTNGGAVVAGGKVYVGGVDGKLYAFNNVTGAPVAGFPVNVAAAIDVSTPAVGGGRVFVGGNDSKLHAYNAATGAAVAGFPVTLGAIVQSTPSLALGNVYVGCNDGKLYAFNATTGVPVPGFPVIVTVGGVVYASPTVVNGKVYIGGANAFSALQAFDALTGATVPGFPINTGSNQFNTTVAASGATGFFGQDPFTLLGFRLANGVFTPGFPLTTPGAIFGSPAIAGGKVYVGWDNSGFSAYSTTGGSPVWTRTLESNARGSPMVANGVIYTSTTNRLYALSAATGGTLWSADATSIGIGFNSPVVADGIVYYASADGNLYAFSVHGQAPASRMAGGALGVVPALSALKPDYSLKAQRKP